MSESIQEQIEEQRATSTPTRRATVPAMAGHMLPPDGVMNLICNNHDIVKFIWNRDIARNYVQKFHLLSELEKISIIY